MACYCRGQAHSRLTTDSQPAGPSSACHSGWHRARGEMTGWGRPGSSDPTRDPVHQRHGVGRPNPWAITGHMNRSQGEREKERDACRKGLTAFRLGSRCLGEAWRFPREQGICQGRGSNRMPSPPGGDAGGGTANTTSPSVSLLACVSVCLSYSRESERERECMYVTCPIHTNPHAIPGSMSLFAWGPWTRTDDAEVASRSPSPAGHRSPIVSRSCSFVFVLFLLRPSLSLFPLPPPTHHSTTTS